MKNKLHLIVLMVFFVSIIFSINTEVKAEELLESGTYILSIPYCKIKSKKRNGANWDKGWGKDKHTHIPPDPQATLKFNNEKIVLPKQSNTYEPQWNNKYFEINYISKSDRLIVEVIDLDQFGHHDVIATFQLDFRLLKLGPNTFRIPDEFGSIESITFELNLKDDYIIHGKQLDSYALSPQDLLQMKNIANITSNPTLKNIINEIYLLQRNGGGVLIARRKLHMIEGLYENTNDTFWGKSTNSRNFQLLHEQIFVVDNTGLVYSFGYYNGDVLRKDALDEFIEYYELQRTNIRPDKIFEAMNRVVPREYSVLPVSPGQYNCQKWVAEVIEIAK